LFLFLGIFIEEATGSKSKNYFAEVTKSIGDPKSNRKKWVEFYRVLEPISEVLN
jgi:hypothetical protein